jgi:hypothetical protein
MDLVTLQQTAVGLVRPGERVLWVGVPRQGLFLRLSDLFVVPFSLVWAGIAVLWTVSATIAGAPLVFTLWGCMFVAFGTYFVVGRFFVDAWRRKGTIYVLTDQRLVEQSRRTELWTPLSQLGVVEYIAHSGGRGSIRYGAAAARRRFLPGLELPLGWPGESKYQRPSLDSIADARNVYDQLLAAVSAAGEQWAGQQRRSSRRSGAPRTESRSTTEQ